MRPKPIKLPAELFDDPQVDLLLYVVMQEDSLTWAGIFVPLPEPDVDELIGDLQAHGVVVKDRQAFRRDLACVVSVARYLSGAAYESGEGVPWVIRKKLANIRDRRAKLLEERAKLLEELAELDRIERRYEKYACPPRLWQRGCRGRPSFSPPRMMSPSLEDVYQRNTGEIASGVEGAYPVFAEWVMARGENRQRQALGRSLYQTRRRKKKAANR